MKVIKSLIDWVVKDGTFMSLYNLVFPIVESTPEIVKLSLSLQILRSDIESRELGTVDQLYEKKC